MSMCNKNGTALDLIFDFGIIVLEIQSLNINELSSNTYREELNKQEHIECELFFVRFTWYLSNGF